MKEPCRSCDEKHKDLGGCRCQAFMLTGDASNADPVCSKSPHHDVILKARDEADVPGQGMEHLTLRNEKGFATDLSRMSCEHRTLWERACSRKRCVSQ